ncbi:hypothetical protein J4232_02865 [Candidatus Woesearchaeota archaeon]|nr:hypothetical protein [Candidatus Woesearchaeota archaeon]
MKNNKNCMGDEKQIIEEKVRCDIIVVLDKLIIKLQRKDINDLGNISNEIIHCASVFQDVHSVSIAVVAYALYKIVEREDNIDPQFITRLIKARNYLQKYKIERFNKEINQLTKEITKKDRQLNLYIKHVFNEAEIKKGSKIYDHGISLAQTAKLLNISQWELMKYIGKTKVIDFLPEKIDVKQRLQFTRLLFRQSTVNNKV